MVTGTATEVPRNSGQPLGTLLAARTDIYAARRDNPHTGKGTWFPAVRGRWI